MTGQSANENSPSNKQYARWKTLIPFVYDWFNNHNLTPWPSLTCRWGEQCEVHTYKNKQRLYLSERTDGSAPNTLVVYNAEVVRPRVAAAEHISKFHEEVRSAFLKKHKTIPHPGEVNKIQLYLWNVNTQPGAKGDSKSLDPNPDLILVGHKENAEFALSLSPVAPRVCSGGKDNLVLLWSLEDHLPSLSAPTNPEGAAIKKSPQVMCRTRFSGHKDTVEDVQFHPSQPEELCSVGDDRALLFWDGRAGLKPVLQVANAHSADVHCVDWSPFEEHLVITGSADNTLNLFDRRKMTSASSKCDPIHTFIAHGAAITTVEWNPHAKGVVASGAEDTRLNVWDCGRFGAKQTAEERKYGPPELIFQHAGHRSQVVDLHWNPKDPWTMLSVSDDGDQGGGGTLQMWRMNDLIYRPEKEVLAELEKHRHMLTKKKKEAMPAVRAPKPAEAKPSAKVAKLSKEADVKTADKEAGDKEAGDKEAGETVVVDASEAKEVDAVATEEVAKEEVVEEEVTKAEVVEEQGVKAAEASAARDAADMTTSVASEEDPVKPAEPAVSGAILQEDQMDGEANGTSEGGKIGKDSDEEMAAEVVVEETPRPAMDSESTEQQETKAVDEDGVQTVGTEVAGEVPVAVEGEVEATEAVMEEVEKDAPPAEVGQEEAVTTGSGEPKDTEMDAAE